MQGSVATSPVALRWILTYERLNTMTSVRAEWLWPMISIGACCHSVKLCAHAGRDFRSQQNGAMTRMWRSCRVQPWHKERAIGAVRCKKEGMLLQPLRWRCVECVIRHERDVREEQQYRYAARTSNNRVIAEQCCQCGFFEAKFVIFGLFSIPLAFFYFWKKAKWNLAFFGLFGELYYLCRFGRFHDDFGRLPGTGTF